MIETKIQVLQDELNNMIDKGVSFEDIYELSVKLDELILQYYHNRLGTVADVS